MRRTHPVAAAVLGAVITLIAVVALPGLGIGQTSTSHGVTPSDVYATTGPPGRGDLCSRGHLRRATGLADEGHRRGPLKPTRLLHLRVVRPGSEHGTTPQLPGP
jgi:hypothetical protein